MIGAWTLKQLVTAAMAWTLACMDLSAQIDLSQVLARPAADEVAAEAESDAEAEDSKSAKTALFYIKGR